MRKEYRKALRKLFTGRLASEVPTLESVKIKAPILWGGESVFLWAWGSAHGYLLLVPSPQGHESFTLELAWSNQGRFPEVTSRPSIMLAAEDPLPLDVEEGVVRIGGLDAGSDVWWELPNPPLEKPGSVKALQWSVDPLPAEEAEKAVEEVLPEAFELLHRVGLPFLEAVVSNAHGASVSLERSIS